MPRGIPNDPVAAAARRAAKAEQKRRAQFPHAVGQQPASSASGIDNTPGALANKLVAEMARAIPQSIPLTERFASDLRQAAFVLETVAHMRGMEREYLPIAERLRAAASGN